MPVELLTGDEVAKLLRVSRDTVYRLATRGELPGRKVGRVWRFSKEAIALYVDEIVSRTKGLSMSATPSSTSNLVRILLALFLLTAAPADAQDPNDIAQLRAELAAQQTLNQKLLERFEAVEAGQAVLLKKIQVMEASLPEDGELRESALQELREEQFELQKKLDQMPTLSGYLDVEYFDDDREDSPGEFRQHHLSLHLSKEWERWRVFSEFELEYGTKIEGEGGDELEEARGEVKLEQAWGEYVYSDLLKLRGGLILTPGYWNVNHYPHVMLSTRRPLLVRQVFREAFVGLMAHGSKHWEDLGMTYYGYLGNGQSVFFTKHDDNESKDVGGKVTFHLPTNGKLDTLDVGLSLSQDRPTGEGRFFTWGLDAQVRKGPWEILSEFAARDAEEERTGFYLQPSYRFNEKWATFYRFDLLEIERDEETQEHSLGVNYRPIPNVSLKLEYFYSRHSEDEDFSGVAASAAIGF